VSVSRKDQQGRKVVYSLELMSDRRPSAEEMEYYLVQGGVRQVGVNPASSVGVVTGIGVEEAVKGREGRNGLGGETAIEAIEAFEFVAIGKREVLFVGLGETVESCPRLPPPEP
jgi:hypothetical protein